MVKKVKVSIVLPCYNVEKYLEVCIDSVLASTLQDIEVILVDDGSTDNCGKIIDEYAKKDSRIIPIHKKNGGYGSAVNLGISKASGEYIGIVETDDWISADMYEKLYDAALLSKADCVKGNFYHCYSSENRVPHQFHPQLPIKKNFTLKEYPQLLLLAPSIWSAIYRKDFLKKNQIKLVENIRPYEDLPFAFEVYSKAKSIFLVNDYLYNYRCEQNQGSSTIRKDRKLFNVVKQMKITIKKLYQIDAWSYTKDAVYKHLYNTMRLFVGNANIFLKKSLYAEFYKLSCIFKCDNVCYTYFSPEEIKKVQQLERNAFFKYFLSVLWHKFYKQHVYTEIKDNRKILHIGFLKISYKYNRPKPYIIEGINNKIIVIENEKERVLSAFDSIPGTKIHIHGSNNIIKLFMPINASNLEIECGNDNVTVEIHNTEWITNTRIRCCFGNRQKVYIGDRTSVSGAEIYCDGQSSVFIGQDCMLARGLTIWADDGHTILDNQTKCIINYPSETGVYIANHVWVGEFCTLNKSAYISNDSIVASHSLVVSKFTKDNIILGGHPAKILRENITWDRRNTYNYDRIFKKGHFD